MSEVATPKDYPAAVIGMGLMGTSIISCLLSAGHDVIGVDTDASRREKSVSTIRQNFAELSGEGLFNEAEIDDVLSRFSTVDSISELSDRKIVIEAIFEDKDLKKSVIADLDSVLDSAAIIGSNTSSIPITELQEGSAHPERVVGIHWAEPAHITRFLEIICGEQTDIDQAQVVKALAEHWGKEPSMVKKDIRGFITNRLMYALMREAFHLVENGVCDIEDVDRSIRNDLGCWMTLAGPFRFMDLTGIPAYGAVMEDLNKELCNSGDVPELMKKVVEGGALGVANAKGFYEYTEESAKEWEEKFVKFSYDIRALSLKYPE